MLIRFIIHSFILIWSVEVVVLLCPSVGPFVIFPWKEVTFLCPYHLFISYLSLFLACNCVADYLRLFFSVQPFLMFYQRIVRLKSKKKTLYQGKIHHILCPEIPNPEKFLNRYLRTEGERYCCESFFFFDNRHAIVYLDATDWLIPSLLPSVPS